MHLLFTGMFLLGTTSFAMILYYLQDINRRLVLVNSSNVQLLNGMHEGLLILTRADKDETKILFCNFSARKLI